MAERDFQVYDQGGMHFEGSQWYVKTRVRMAEFGDKLEAKVGAPAVLVNAAIAIIGAGVLETIEVRKQKRAAKKSSKVRTQQVSSSPKF